MTIITKLNSSGRFRCGTCGDKAEHCYPHLHNEVVVYLCRTCAHDLADTILSESLVLLEADYDQVAP